jgi:hypothetical protein
LVGCSWGNLKKESLSFPVGGCRNRGSIWVPSAVKIHER